MTTLTARLPRVRPNSVLTIVAMTASLVLGAQLVDGATARLVLATAAAILLCAVGLRSPRVLLFGLLFWLPLLGLVRRLVTTLGSAGPFGDPLLLVAPAAWLLLAAVAFSRGALRQRTALGSTVLALTALLTVSAVNPLQGGLTVGLAGVMLVVIPMLAFWVGRSLVDDRILRWILIVLAVLALPAAAYGLFQTFSGFPSWDAQWIAQDGYTALNVGGTIRAFGTFASSSEYVTYVAAGFAAWLALGRGLLRLPLTMTALVLLGAAMWLDSSRGIIVLTSVAVVLVLLAHRGVALRWALIGAVALLVALPWLVGHAVSAQPSGGPTAGLVAHQVQGLTNPFGQQSTLPTHIAMVVGGMQDAVTNPIGRGVGAVTSAAGKYGGNVASTEADPGNAAAAAGALGLLGYVLLVVRALPLAYRTAARRRDAVALAVLGILSVTFLQWLNGAQYAVAPLPWLVLGWLDRQPSHDPPDAAPKEAQ